MFADAKVGSGWILELLFVAPYIMNVALPFFFVKVDLAVLWLGDCIMATDEFEGLRLLTICRRASCYSRVGIPVSAFGRSPASFFSKMKVDC